MNNPLRYGGLTFYQANVRTPNFNYDSGFQVVSNPTRTLPYIACMLVGLGLLLHFVTRLASYRPKRSSGQPAPAILSPVFIKKFLAPILTLLCVIWIIFTLFPRKPASAFDIASFGHLPVLADGRVKPLDTIARTALLRIQSNQHVTAPDGREVTPTEWLLDTIFNPAVASQYRIFQITNPEVLALLQLAPEDGRGKKYFSYAQLEPHFDDIERQAQLADSVEDSQRNAFQRTILELYGSLDEYKQLQYSFVSPESPDFLRNLTRFHAPPVAGSFGGRSSVVSGTFNEPLKGAPLVFTFSSTVVSGTFNEPPIEDLRSEAALMSEYGSLLVMPPNATQPTWLKTGDALITAIDARPPLPVAGTLSALAAANAAGPPLPPAAFAYAGMARTWQAGQPDQFNEMLHTYQEQIAKLLPSGDLSKTNAEWRFNAAQPFYVGMILYVLVFLLGVVSWIKWPDALGRSAFWLMCLAWVLMTAGIITRMWLEGRPPVTNLYSSALGVGWAAVTLCVILEAINKNAIASVAGGLAGFGTLIIAHHLSLSGDTMEMMRAVLDSNFWLATHVVTITVGYGATYLAGVLAAIYILRSRLTTSLDGQTAASLERMVYGTVCFAIFFSFVGTVLGGIWADQSWGRFWGWDPKENGALIIVIWNAVVLHARWGKFVGPTGVMAMAVFGNIVTTWSWFGVNQLGVGLHSYGFTSGNTLPIAIFMLVNVVFIVLAQLPARVKKYDVQG